MAAERVIVLGASSGIGAAIARQLGASGAHVALLGRREERLHEVAKEVTSAGGKAIVRAHDVTDFDAVAPLFDELLELLYVSGAMPTIDEHEYSPQKDRQMMEVNVLGAMAWFNPAAAHMEAARSGTIIGVSSIAGERGRRGNPAYCTSKAAMTTYLESLRNRLHRYGVRVVTAKPGFVRTAMTEGMGDLLWIIDADEAARQILALGASGRSVSAFVPGRWWMVALVIRSIPSWIFRKLNL
jgi:NAD(P)-dependent dehydrogenase (short-subunit alcohol dehydrogenase family)